MAQNQVKKKSKSVKATHKKPAGPKKGGRIIAPKKSRHIKAAKLKKNFEKAIKTNIEQELAGQATSKESKPFTFVQTPTTGTSGKKGKGKKGKK
ncbi:leydig cell tumor 10 kDa protein homolog [Nematostella vectensis]|uniref:leydig cell tumor 10 kDa protein homolog n=1 Tax=Nematostella vectensis TaxID=45351 RepID=UPI002076E614|nr:leydig cell tumor 10 kDa protein homolog [Nematostella vectensis]